jgi:hypothetical protein
MVWPMLETLAAFIQALDALAIRTLICHCQRSGGVDADARQQQQAQEHTNSCCGLTIKVKISSPIFAQYSANIGD